MFLKLSIDLAILISGGKSFQSLGGAATKAQSPRVVKVWLRQPYAVVRSQSVR